MDYQHSNDFTGLTLRQPTTSQTATLEESVQHLIFECHNSREIWQLVINHLARSPDTNGTLHRQHRQQEGHRQHRTQATTNNPICVTNIHDIQNKTHSELTRVVIRFYSVAHMAGKE